MVIAMPRPRSRHVADVKQQLVARLREMRHRPGQRFLSNRAVARRYGVSYQTADVLMRQLADEGLIVRRAASGSYVPGTVTAWGGVVLAFSPRARHKGSFGSHLLDRLRSRLAAEHVNWVMSWTTSPGQHRRRLGATRYPVIWERPDAVDAAIRQARTSLLLNARPPAGAGAALIDSVSIDDFSGGAHAAQFLLQRRRGTAPLAILAGPPHDARSDGRVAGFLSVAPATVIAAPDWFLQGGLAVADLALAAGPGGLFCCNDRLAQAVLRRVADRKIRRPPLVGFDDAPVARYLDLTTIAIPWDDLVDAAVGVILRRRAEPASAAIAQLVSTRLIIRD